MDKINNLLSSQNFTQEPIGIIIVDLIICMMLVSLVSWFYKRYSQSLGGKTHVGSILPLIGLTVFLVITVVKSSLALSLGLVGALSIVRYRTPIKSVYELALLFFLITLGVTASVNIKYAIFLITIIIFFPIVLKILFKFNFLKIQHLVISDVDKYVEANYLFNNTLSEINNEINLDNHIQNIDEDYDNRSTEIMMKFDNMEDHLKMKNKIDTLKALKVKNVSVSKRN